jgi:hypothetical protein
MGSVRVIKRPVRFAGFLARSVGISPQTNTVDQREGDDVAFYLQSVAATVYKLAWPTAKSLALMERRCCAFPYPLLESGFG